MGIIAYGDDDADGQVDSIVAERVQWSYDKQGDSVDRRVLESKSVIPSDLVLVAIDFSGTAERNAESRRSGINCS